MFRNMTRKITIDLLNQKSPFFTPATGVIKRQAKSSDSDEEAFKEIQTPETAPKPE